MSSPQLSILITVYNVEKYLRECLDSVAAQSFGDFEAVIVDDGSTDSSGAIADEYARSDSRFIVLHTVNRGVLLARKTAAENASGSYFLNIDSDDRLDERLLQCVHEQLEERKWDMVFYDFSVFNDNGVAYTENYFPAPRTFGEGDTAELFRLLLTTSFNSLCVKCYSREVAQKSLAALDYDFFAGVSHSEDLLQSAYILSSIRSAAYINQSLYFYRAGIGVSQRFDSGSLLRSSDVADAVALLMREKSLDTIENLRELHSMCRKILNNYMGLMAKSNLSLSECTRLMKIASGTSLYSRAMSPCGRCGASRKQNLKFSLLRHGLTRTAMLTQKIKAVR